ncbi:septal ring lytic transglycosylase RlpA family protein [Massilia sp.]|jgi:rare lipoprotein A|uniref:septal ring lytic transglycosylase RlpA family protein n=1 Tax=Massilia sp. TaxID=1882437 RepID=UPI0028A9C08A|nr:septal ring lytic transglycosylase RlpA family protein [Massilia sp.]
MARMTAQRSLPVVIALAALMTGCGTTEGNKTLVPLPWKHKVTKPGAINPKLPPANSGRGGYYKDDGPGTDIPDGLEFTPDAVVKAEPYAKWANRPYSVFGQSYTPLLNEEPFVQKGVASWYGVKFHGQKTSSGEPYDMYKMTAAHPTLPIPSYARITHVATGRSVVVRINDRGPFHASRVVDVSYTAALKLGLLGKGSHEVEIERLFPGDEIRLASERRAATSAAQAAAPAADVPPEIAALMLEDRMQSDSAAVAQALPAVAAAAKAGKASGQFYLQLGSFSQADKAQEMGRLLADAGLALGDIEVVPSGSVNRLYGGPFESRAAAQEAARGLPSGLGIKPIVVKR